MGGTLGKTAPVPEAVASRSLSGSAPRNLEVAVDAGNCTHASDTPAGARLVTPAVAANGAVELRSRTGGATIQPGAMAVHLCGGANVRVFPKWKEWSPEDSFSTQFQPLNCTRLYVDELKQ